MGFLAFAEELIRLSFEQLRVNHTWKGSSQVKKEMSGHFAGSIAHLKMHREFDQAGLI